MFILGQLANEAGDAAEAKKWWSQAADREYVDAMVCVSELLDDQGETAEAA
jgi:hypothetical protein